MAQTTGKIKGKLIKVTIDDDPVSRGGLGNPVLAGCQTDFNANFETTELEATCKDDGNFSDAIPDENSASFDLGLLVRFDSPMNIEKLKALWKAQTVCEVTVSTGVVGDPISTYIAFLTNVTEGAPVQGIATVGTSWKVKGEPDFDVVT